MLLKKHQKVPHTNCVNSVPPQEFFQILLRLYRLSPLGPDCHPYQREHSCRGINVRWKNKMIVANEFLSTRDNRYTFLNHDHIEQSCHRWCGITSAQDIQSMVPVNSRCTHRAA